MRILLEQLRPELRAQAEKKLAEQTPRTVSPMGHTYRKRGKNGSKSTAHDKLLWQISVLGLPTPVREYKFHPKRKWRSDYAWPDEKWAIEIEGITREGGRHQRLAGFTADVEKYNALAALGWKLIRLTPRHIRRGQSMQMIYDAFKNDAFKNEEGRHAGIANGDVRSGRQTGRR